MHMIQFSKIAVTALVAAVLTASVGCSSPNKNVSPTGTSSSPAATSSPSAQQPPTEITIVSPTYGDSPSNELDSLKQVNQKLNIKINATYVPANNYPDKINAILATNDLPDMIVVWDPNTSSWANAIQQGAFWDLTPYIKNYPNLANIPQDIYTAQLINGKSFGIPRVRPLDGAESMYIRQDWLDKLGLKPPQTTDELMKVMEAFTKGDPDGNGQADTYGFVAYPFQTYLTSIFNGAYGAAMGGFKVAGDTLATRIDSQETHDALAYWQNVYKSGYFVPDFPVLKTSQPREYFIQGKAGILFTNVNENYAAPNMIKEIQKTTPTAKLGVYEVPAAPDGKRYYERGLGSYGMLMVNKEASEANLKKILELLDYSSSLEGNLLIGYGIKDVDYTVSNPKLPHVITQTDAGKAKAYPNSWQWVCGFYNKYLRAESGDMTDAELAYNHGLLDTIEKSSSQDGSAGIISPAWNEKSADWSKKIVDAQVNTLIGKMSMDEWDKFVNGLKNDPAWAKIVEEFNNGYKAKLGK